MRCTWWLVLALLSPSLMAQVSNDLLGRKVISLRGPTGLLVLESTHEADDARAVLMDGAGNETASLQLPMNHVTGGIWLGVSPWNWLVCGIDFDAAGASRTGVICRLTWSGSTMAVAQSSVLSTVWPMSIGLTPGGVAVLDGKLRAILVAPSNVMGFGQLPVDGQWVSLADHQALPELAEPGYLSYMNLGNDQTNMYLLSGRGAVFSRQFSMVGSSLQLTGSQDREGTIDMVTANGSTGFDVWLPPNSNSAQVREPESGTILATLTGAPNTRGNTGPLSAVVQNPGQRLEIYFPGDETRSHYVWPGVRYGEPLSIPELVVGKLVAEPLIEAGQANFGVAMGARRTAVGGSVICAISLALRRPDGSDPVIVGLGATGQQALLIPDASVLLLADTGQLVDNVGKLIGTNGGSAVLLSQFIVLGATEIGVSDVASTTIVAAQSAAMQGGSGGQEEAGGAISSGTMQASYGATVILTIDGVEVCLPWSMGGLTGGAMSISAAGGSAGFTSASPWEAACARFGVSTPSAGGVSYW